MKDFAGKTAVITGGASGIGLAMARRFGAAGMNLVLGDIDQVELDQAIAELDGAGHAVAGMRLDVRDLDAIVAFESFARESFGNVHVLCNNAGVGAGGRVADLDNLDLWKWTIDIDLWGVIYGCKVFVPGMIEHGEDAHVVNTASMAGHIAAPMMGAYNVAKYGVVALSETLSKEMQIAKTNVGVSVVCPAFVATKIASSDRNLPEELRPNPLDSGNDAKPSQVQEMMSELVASGIPSQDVADAVHDAVRDDSFWVLTHPETKASITERAAQIVEGINPPIKASFL